MTMISTGLSTVGLRSEFFEKFEQRNRNTHWQELTTRIESRSKTETYKWLGATPQLREWGTGRRVQGMFSESYDVKDIKYEATIEVDREEIEDDQTGQIRVRIGELAVRAATHKDSLIGSLLENGGSAGFNAYDGKTFFATDHESGKSGAQDNTLTESGTADKDNPTTAEFRAALKSAIARLLQFKDDQGQNMSFGATGLVIVVPPNMVITASEAVNATLVASTTNVLQGAAKIIGLPNLTSTDKFYLLKTDVGVRPFVYQVRKEPEFTALENNTDEGFKRDKFLYGVRARYRITYGYWQYALRITFTA